MSDLASAILADRALIRALSDAQLDTLREVLERHLPVFAETEAAGPAESAAPMLAADVETTGDGELLLGADAPLVAYVDGACSGNPGPGGWAVHFAGAGIEAFGGEDHTTNNRMEIVAATEALRRVAPGAAVEIVTDSKLVVETMDGAWKRKSNIELWAALDAARAGKTVTFTWVKGHNGNPGNARADELAQRESQRRRESLAASLT